MIHIKLAQGSHTLSAVLIRRRWKFRFRFRFSFSFKFLVKLRIENIIVGFVCGGLVLVCSIRMFWTGPNVFDRVPMFVPYFFRDNAKRTASQRGTGNG